MPYLSKQEIECIGNRVIRAYKRLNQAEDRILEKVDIEDLARSLLGLQVQYHRLSADGSVLGVTAFSELSYRIFDQLEDIEYADMDGRTVLIDRDLRADQTQVGRKNFTIAHETSHHILHMLYPENYGVQYRYRTELLYRAGLGMHGPKDRDEWQADALASVILLPEESVRAAMDQFGLGPKMHRLNRVFSPVEYEQFSEMAEYLNVSKTALAIRMTTLDLLEENYLGRPYDIASVYPDNDDSDIF